MLIISFTKNVSANTHQGATSLNGLRVVMRHAHGELAESVVGSKPVGLDFMKEIGQGLKLLAHLLHIVGIGSHAHQSGYTHVAELVPSPLTEHLAALVGAETKLGLFERDVNLQQTANRTVNLLCLSVHLLEQAVGVDAVNQRHVGYQVLHLVSLQVTNEVPLYVFR